MVLALTLKPVRPHWLHQNCVISYLLPPHAREIDGRRLVARCQLLATCHLKLRPLTQSPLQMVQTRKVVWIACSILHHWLTDGGPHLTAAWSVLDTEMQSGLDVATGIEPVQLMPLTGVQCATYRMDVLSVI